MVPVKSFPSCNGYWELDNMAWLVPLISSSVYLHLGAGGAFLFHSCAVSGIGGSSCMAGVQNNVQNKESWVK